MNVALDGQTLYVVTGEAIAVVEPAGDRAPGTVTGRFGDPTLSSPTALARHDSSLLVVNSQFANLQGELELPFTASSVPIPAALAATPSARPSRHPALGGAVDAEPGVPRGSGRVSTPTRR